MAEELTDAKLAEAYKHFTAGNYTESLKVLSSLPQEDVKVKNNTTLLNYLQKGGAARDVVSDLCAVPPAFAPVGTSTEDAAVAAAAVASAPLGGSLPEFLYDGHEGAFYNSAVILLHNGFVEKAQGIFRELVSRKPPVAPEIEIRSAFMLQIATRPLNKKKMVSRGDEEIISSVFASHFKLLQNSPVLKKMFQLAFCETSNVHDWFKDGEKRPSDKLTYFNNLGALAMNDGKWNLASIYFNNALKAYTEMNNKNNNNTNNNKNNTNNSSDEEGAPNDLVLHSVLYNSGICALFRKEYGSAVKSLLLTQGSMKGSPFLWLRIAQAALGVYAHHSAVALSEDYASSQNAIAADLKKRGRLLPSFQLLGMPTLLSLYGSNTDANSRTALDTAMKAVNNGLGLLIPKDTHIVVAADSLVLSGSTSLFRVFQYLLLYSAYIEMQRMNYSVASAITTDLLALGKGGHPLQPEVLITTIMYAAEALCYLNKPTAALKILQSVSASDFIITEGNIDDQKMRVAAVMINLALVHIANGNWKTASTMTTNLIAKYNATPAASPSSPSGAAPATALSALLSNNFTQTPSASITTNQPIASQWHHIARVATVLQVFIELAQGNRDRALEILALQPVAPPLVCA